MYRSKSRVISLNVWWDWHVLVVQSSGVMVRKKVPGLSLITKAWWWISIIIVLFVFNSNDSANFLSDAKMACTSVYERETCFVHLFWYLAYNARNRVAFIFHLRARWAHVRWRLPVSLIEEKLLFKGFSFKATTNRELFGKTIYVNTETEKITCHKTLGTRVAFYSRHHPVCR